jgi:hypothetical protein
MSQHQKIKIRASKHVIKTIDREKDKLDPFHDYDLFQELEELRQEIIDNDELFVAIDDIKCMHKNLKKFCAKF